MIDKEEKTLKKNRRDRPITRESVLFSSESKALACVFYGDAEKIKEQLLTVVKLYHEKNAAKESSIVLARYNAVSFLSAAIRLAVTSGVPEPEAYNFCDNAILKIHSMNNVEEIDSYLLKAAAELTKIVRNAVYKREYSEIIRNCMNYIYRNISSKITLKNLASMSNITPSYLSSLFKRETGVTLSDFIMFEKVKYGAGMLLSGEYSCIQVSDKMGFCSQSYFCKCFKQVYGITPMEFCENPIRIELTRSFSQSL